MCTPPQALVLGLIQVLQWMVPRAGRQFCPLFSKGKCSLQVAFMFNEWYKPHSTLEFPRGGSQAMVDALARGVSKRGGRLHARSHVDEVVLEGGRAAGVRLKGGATVCRFLSPHVL